MYGFSSTFTPIHRQGMFSSQGPDIVESVNMVRMGMGEQHTLQASDAGT